MGLRLHEFYDMPWCEYLIKSYAYHRKQEDDWIKYRYLAWHTLAASMKIDGKKLPTLEKFATGANKTIKKASDAVKNLFLEQYKQYLERKKSKR